jgi:glycosyltransferase involved in cell wall biosynthesis
VVANSTRTLEGWRRVLGPARFERRPHAVIPNPVDPAEFEARFERDTPERLVIGGLGRFQPQKGFDLLLEAFAALPAELDGRGLHLRLQGHGPDEPRLRLRASELGVAPRVEFVPFTPRVQPFLHALDVLVVPSRWAGFENVALEGVLCGAPVLCSTGAGLEALQHDAAFAPFEPTVPALEHALRRFLARAPHERTALARAQFQRVVAELDAARIAERFEGFLCTSGLLERG